MILQDDHFVLVGVMSFAPGCDKPGAPGVYARVTSQIGWVHKLVKGDKCSKKGSDRISVEHF